MSAMTLSCWRLVCDRCRVAAPAHYESKHDVLISPRPDGWGKNMIGWDLCPACRTPDTIHGWRPMAQTTGQGDQRARPPGDATMSEPAVEPSALEWCMALSAVELMVIISRALRAGDMKAAATATQLLRDKDPASYRLIVGTVRALTDRGGDRG